MNVDQLFLETLSDLEERIQEPSEYGMLRSAGLMRQLLLDGSRLTDQVNRTRRMKLTFSVANADGYLKVILEDQPVFYSCGDGIDPATSPFGEVAELGRDQFLATQIMIVDGQAVSVRDLIDQLANIEGGVHSGEAVSPREIALREASSVIRVGGLPAAAQMTAAVGRVVLKGLAPLREAVSKSQT